MSFKKNARELFRPTGRAILALATAVFAGIAQAAITVSLDQPSSGQQLYTPANVTLSASATDTTGTITQVDFLDGATVIGTVTAAPYQLAVTIAAPGRHTLKARVTDDSGATATSAGVALDVLGLPTVSLTAPGNAAIIAGPADVAVKATATEAHGTISSVNILANGNTIATLTATPYTFTWPSVAPGTYALTANATDALGTTVTSNTVNITVDSPPSVTLSAPADGGVFAAKQSLALSASATQATGSITKVDFFRSGTRIGTATAAPFNFTWNNIPAGNWVITAVATNDAGATAASNAASIRVDAAPTVSIISPGNNTPFSPPATVSIEASAAVAVGTLTQIDFYASGTLIGSATAPPYVLNWTNVQSGKYVFTAVATNDIGVQTTSAGVTVFVDTPPTVRLTAPKDGLIVSPQTAVPLTAAASNSVGKITEVDFFVNGQQIGSATAAPYTFTWNASTVLGRNTITAVALNDAGMSTTSDPVTVNVDVPPTVTLLSPANGTIFVARQDITLTAAASASVGAGQVNISFFRDNTLIASASAGGEIPTATVTWSKVPPGNFILTAVATDRLGAQTTSAPVNITVDSQPKVSITSPINRALVPAGGPLSITATAVDTVGTVTNVDFFVDGTLIASSSTPPYTVQWNSATPGQHALTAAATNDAGTTNTSARVNVTVFAPVVSLTAPSGDASFAVGTPIQLAATATDAQGTISRVDFFQGTTLVGTSTDAPYAFQWNGAAPGVYSVTAVATDSLGAVGTSGAVQVTVYGPPTVSLVTPVTEARFRTPASIQLQASPQDAFAAIAKVDFFHDGVLIGTATEPPYLFTWSNVATGSYSLTAVVTNAFGETASSAAISISVDTSVAQLYFVHVDHLDTPRALTDQNQSVVWTWDQAEPFGSTPANEDPSASGASLVSFNLRFPGQYFDAETGSFYNMARDYDPTTGRYFESDPIGLSGESNTYSYVRGIPINRIDPTGLLSLTISIGGSFVPGFGGEGSVGMYATFPWPGNTIDFGVYGSGGFGPGYNIGGGPQFGAVKGNESDISGITTNINGGTTPFGGTVMLDPNGNPVGFSVGPAAEFGASVTHADTGAAGLNDLGRWLGGWLYDKLHPDSDTEKKSCP